MNHELPEAFRRLLAEFCQSTGLALDDQATALEFAADGHVAVIGSDPRSRDRLLVQVETAGLVLNPELALLLHQINNAAMLEHDWVISCGVDGTLRLHTQVMLAHTTDGDLQGLLADGIERAQALAQMLDDLESEDAQPGESAPHSGLDISPGAFGMLRG